ncbi:capsule biosynthesis protein [Marinilabiliaceae bacterium JC040]|nr:capsule biosynthesis protein [Marinilabiliaceae bacterium JC040]
MYKYLNYMKRILLFVLTLFLLGMSVSKGQTQEQIEMAKKMAKQMGYSDAEIENLVKQNVKSKKTQVVKAKAVNRNNPKNNKMGNNPYGFKGNYSLPQNSVYNQYLNNQNSFNLQEKKKKAKVNIYGHSIFENENLNFIPSYNVPTPKGYKLNAGDQVIINIWGAVVKTIEADISPEGQVDIPDFGPVNLAGRTLSSAEILLKNQLSRIYSGLKSSNPNTFISISLGQMRSVTVNVVGEVEVPGTYTLPSLSSMISALYMAGGPSKIGSVRNIKLYRKNKLVSDFDVYKFISEGKFVDNLRLEDNDIIIVEPYKNIITLKGKVKRPMKYELKDSDSLEDLMRYSGGFSENAYTDNIHIYRNNGDLNRSFDISKANYKNFKLQDGDNVFIRTTADFNANGVYVQGAVWYPGSYAINKDVKTIANLLKEAGGVLKDAYTDRAIIRRTNDKDEKELIGFSINEILKGNNDINLQRRDTIQIKFEKDLKPKFIVRIVGEVNKPMKTDFREGMNVSDLILMANGLTDAGMLSRVEVSRVDRDKSEKIITSLDAQNTIATTYHLDLQKNIKDRDFKLQPYDVVYIRKAPGYQIKEAISINGEVFYPGQYTMIKRTTRLSDLVKMSRGFTADAYIRGAKLVRKVTQEERERLTKAINIAKSNSSEKQKIKLDTSMIESTYDVAINLDKALEKPGSDADIVLRPGDVLKVPQYNNTITINGAVIVPSVVTYNKKYKWRDYIAQAGGFKKRAWKRRTYVILMNGNVYSKSHKDFRIEPGCQIIVPEKYIDPANRMNFAKIMGMVSAFSSVSATVLAITNMIKK